MPPTPQLNVLQSAEYKIFRVTVLSPFLVTAFHFFLYGLYVPLFRNALVLLKNQPPSRSRWFHQISLITLFIFSSVAVPLGIAYEILHVAVAYYTSTEMLYRTLIILQICRYIIMLIMGFTIDTILVFRCIVVFGFRRKRSVAALVIGLCIIIDTCALSFSIWTEAAFLGKIGEESFLGFSIQQYVSNVFLGLNALVNLSLTSTLAGRIWWMARRNRNLRQAWEKDPANDLSERLNTVVAILLESGLLYIIGLAIFIIGNIAGGHFDTGSVMIQIGGIIPTLIIVRVNAKGRPSEAEESQSDSRHGRSSIFSRSVRSLSEIIPRVNHSLGGPTGLPDSPSDTKLEGLELPSRSRFSTDP
ncbi:hypothetical protein E1B28_012999 [Marasmius oreades]|uniref:Uncharacterized protein n=1 Tax=Marasmius oreades TaxID=181124 RepID=A0A9P7UMH7_9AGAR|nr:uncharacterized protein E1B28_012999 [Marasmius oreades]KAG7087020.1 hypothetical protein E1B28_012999 [Marasmius oreades]